MLCFESLRTFSALNQDHGLSLTLTECCQCIKITTKKFNNSVITTGAYCTSRLDILAEKKSYVVTEHFTHKFSINSFENSRYVNQLHFLIMLMENS